MSSECVCARSGTSLAGFGRSRRATWKSFCQSITFIYVLLQTVFVSVNAGTCWASMSTSGRCEGQFIAYNISTEMCCQMGSGMFAYTTHENVSPMTLFQWIALPDFAPQCTPCTATCEGVECGPEKKCRMRNGRPKCVCAPDCASHRHRHQGPVCGTDGVTYRNTCNLKKRNCRTGGQVLPNYFSECKESCSDVRCPPLHHCAEDQTGRPHCIKCRENCPMVSDNRQLICASNGNTYPSLCEFQRASCLADFSLSISFRGSCQGSQTCEVVTCPNGQECLHEYGSGRPQCLACHLPCMETDRHAPLCGSDDRTYENWCAMRRASCERGYVITTKHEGYCNGDLNYMETSSAQSDSDTSLENVASGYSRV